MDTDLVVSAGALIYSRNTGRYLFLLRNASSYDSSWGLVGGKLEKGEPIMHGLAREICEEIGECDIIRLAPIEQFTSTNKKFIYHTFLAAVEEEFIPHLNNEHRGYCWVFIEDYPKPLHPGVWKTFKFNTVLEKIKTFEATST